jgi:hypothetical protein
MASLPEGWGDRNNEMSEHDMKLGGDAQNKFANKNAYADESGVVYKTSDQVKAFYMQKIQKEVAKVATSAKSSSATMVAATNSVPFGWEDRQRSREAESKQVGAFSRNNNGPQQVISTTPRMESSSAEAALVRVAAHTLDIMAQTLERNPVALSVEERAAFAASMKKAMDAIAKCK